MEAVQGHVNLGYTSVAKAGHVRGINLQVKGGGRDANRTRTRDQCQFERAKKIIFIGVQMLEEYLQETRSRLIRVLFLFNSIGRF